MRRFHFVVTSIIFLALVGCASEPKRTSPIGVAPPVRLDYVAVQNQLGVELPFGQTGLREKTFDACDLGAALNDLSVPLKDCHHAYFTVIQIQLSCRLTEDSSSILSAGDLRPLQNRHLKWTLDKITGETDTDSQGQVTIREISNGSLKRTFLRVSTGIDYLIMRAGEATEIVTSPSWCDSK